MYCRVEVSLGFGGWGEILRPSGLVVWDFICQSDLTLSVFALMVLCVRMFVVSISLPVSSPHPKLFPSRR